MKRYSLTLVVICLMFSLLLGFSLLALLLDTALWLSVLVGLALVILCILLLRFSLAFDRQVQEIKKRKEESSEKDSPQRP
ncbi:MAG: hypothetical protein EOM15_06490 [Spirochaetia bacterium]|nr:hypothetical protein [Spirochaetia bacterium]